MRYNDILRDPFGESMMIELDLCLLKATNMFDGKTYTGKYNMQGTNCCMSLWVCFIARLQVGKFTSTNGFDW